MPPRFALPLLLLTLVAMPAWAGVGKVSSPNVTKGEVEVEYTGVRYGDDRKSLNNKQSHTYEFEYSFTDRFMLGIEAKSDRASPREHRFKGYGLEAQYEMTTQGGWWLDSAVKAEYLHTPRGNVGDEAELSLLARRSYGNSSLTVNAGAKHEVGSGSARGLVLESAVAAKHAFSDRFAPGVEWHADYGTLNHLGHNATHYVGPVVSGELFTFGAHAMEYNVGHFWGLTDDSADGATRVQLSYGVAF